MIDSPAPTAKEKFLECRRCDSRHALAELRQRAKGRGLGCGRCDGASSCWHWPLPRLLRPSPAGRSFSRPTWSSTSTMPARWPTGRRRRCSPSPATRYTRTPPRLSAPSTPGTAGASHRSLRRPARRPGRIALSRISGVVPRSLSAGPVPSALDGYRTVLRAQPDASVTIVSVGFLDNLDQLLRQQPSLVAAKVRELAVMGPARRRLQLRAPRSGADHGSGAGALVDACRHHRLRLRCAHRSRLGEDAAKESRAGSLLPMVPSLVPGAS